jgi:hypothetical protein
VSQALIRQAFESRLETWAAAAWLPVQWQNKILDPEPEAYVRAFLLPSQQEVPDVQGLGRSYSGVWQVTIVRPQNEGPGPAEALAASLAAVYSPSTHITAGGLRVYLLQPLSPAPAISEPARFAVPCSQSYATTVY